MKVTRIAVYIRGGCLHAVSTDAKYPEEKIECVLQDYDNFQCGYSEYVHFPVDYISAKDMNSAFQIADRDEIRKAE